MNTPEKQFVETLSQSQIYRDYETAFRDLTGLPLALSPVETWRVPLHGDRNESPFCREMARASQACAACLRLQEDLRERASIGLATGHCFSKLSHSVVPVKVGERVVALLHTGQIFVKEPSESDFEHTLETLARWGMAVNRRELRRAYFACRVITPEQYRSVLRLLEVFALQLGAIGNQLMLVAKTVENPQMERAKQFIEANLTEDITLADVAAAVHMSSFYFCKMFKQSTGLNYTTYLARLRTERAKTMLLDQHARVSEVAFAVGFQSISQFNRIFREVAGESPSDYRQHVLAPAKRPARRRSRAGAPLAFGVASHCRPISRHGSTGHAVIVAA